MCRQQFNPSTPGHSYEIADVTLMYCTNHIIFQVSRNNFLSPHVDCVTVSCNGNTYCIKFTFEPINSPPGIPCWKIGIKGVAGTCPAPCTY